jgi:hypothetical protein
MKRAQLLGKGLSLFALAVAFVVPGTALADDPYGLAPGQHASSGRGGIYDPTFATWGGGLRTALDATSVSRDSPVTRAREMLTRARFLDDAATTDEKNAAELASRLGSLRTAAKAAREKAEHATPEERELLGARADDLETDAIVSEAEVSFKRRTAADNRRVARELRLRAVKLVREAPADEAATANACDPPFHFTADGRKVYRVECLK